jgi:hypothetical protein
MFRYKIRDVILLTIVTALAVAWYVDHREPRPSIAEKTRAAALAQAKKDNKLVLLVLGLHDKSWCDRLDAYHADPAIRRVLEKYFVLARVDIEEPGGMEMYAERGERGAPAFSILDSHGTVVSDSGQADENFGFPNNPEQVDRYIAALKVACPQITENDVAILRQKLEAMRIPPE